MRHYISGLLFAALFASACNTGNTGDKTNNTATDAAGKTAAAPAKPSSDLSVKGTTDFMAMISSYYELKDALVATDPAKADAAASRVLSGAETLLTDSVDAPRQKAYHAFIDTVMKQSEAIVNVKDETCAKKRVYFERVSDGIYGLAKLVNLKNGNVYRQFCPMAFNDKGAYWLSHESEIKNPYFGRKMLECGEVRDSL